MTAVKHQNIPELENSFIVIYFMYLFVQMLCFAPLKQWYKSSRL